MDSYVLVERQHSSPHGAPPLSGPASEESDVRAARPASLPGPHRQMKDAPADDTPLQATPGSEGGLLMRISLRMRCTGADLTGSPRNAAPSSSELSRSTYGPACRDP